jgi:HSP20 family protein
MARAPVGTRACPLAIALCDDGPAAHAIIMGRPSMLSFPEVHELSDEVRRVFEEFDRLHGPTCHGVSSLYAPALDVVETSAGLEVVVDVPGVPPEALRVFFKDGNLVVVGEKLASEPCRRDGSAFHLVERGFGRFARVIRFSSPVDASTARAVLAAGELRVTVARVENRRGHEIPVRIDERKG